MPLLEMLLLVSLIIRDWPIAVTIAGDRLNVTVQFAAEADRNVLGGC